MNSRTVAYRRAGGGPPIVLLHGFLCDSRVWETQLDALSNAFTVVAWDAPGAGGSDDSPDPYTITDWAHVLVEFLDTLAIGPAHVLGLSWGGLLAQELYRVDAARVRSLILADTYAGWKGSFDESVAQQRLARCTEESTLPPDEFVRRWVPVEFFTEHVSPEVVRQMAAVVADFHPAGFRLMAKALADQDTTGLLPRIDVPTLLIWGDGDLRSPLPVAEAFRDAIPGSELVVIPNAGHISNIEQPERFNEAVRRFCSANEPD